MGLAAENGSEWRIDDHVRNVLDDAIRRKKIIEMVYFSDSSVELTIRRVYPLSTCMTRKGYITFEAWCCLRSHKRVFRVDRIRTLIVTDVAYTDEMVGP